MPCRARADQRHLHARDSSSSRCATQPCSTVSPAARPGTTARRAPRLRAASVPCRGRAPSCVPTGLPQGLSHAPLAGTRPLQPLAQGCQQLPGRGGGTQGASVPPPTQLPFLRRCQWLVARGRTGGTGRGSQGASAVPPARASQPRHKASAFPPPLRDEAMKLFFYLSSFQFRLRKICAPLATLQ